MKHILKLVHWKSCLIASIGVLCILIVFNFYGLYTNKFYLFKPDNYIFPLLAIVHFIFLYVLWFKLKVKEYTDPQMRNLEYSLYVICLVYVFKALDTAYILMSYKDYSDHIIPDTFMPIGILIFSLQMLLLGLTLLSFAHRKALIGSYKFDKINENIDSWQ